MEGHLHTDFPMFVFAGVSAIVFIHLLRFLAAQMVSNEGTRGAGEVLGAIVNFG
jgi:hypothetical protein